MNQQTCLCPIAEANTPPATMYSSPDVAPPFPGVAFSSPTASVLPPKQNTPIPDDPRVTATALPGVRVAALLPAILFDPALSDGHGLRHHVAAFDGAPPAQAPASESGINGAMHIPELFGPFLPAGIVDARSFC